MTTFTIDAQNFLLDGKPFRILSGAMHYFRVHPNYWIDRMLKLKAMGLNTLETYVAWNLHEPRPGEFDFSGWLDLQAYIRLAGKLGLYVIVRPGPYICSEWEFGGLPAWLLKDGSMRVRCAYPPYLAAVDRFMDQLVPQMAALQITRGGPIIAVQVENEYGSFGNDSVYLQYLQDGLHKRGIDVLLFTSDGPTDEMLQYGTLPRVLKMANFGSRAREGFDKLREYQPDGPLMCAEFWNGWFDHWGETHHTGVTPPPVPEMSPAAAFGKVELTHSAVLFDHLDVLSKPVESALPETMEALGQNYGLILYSTMVSGPREETVLRIPQVHDRAIVWANGKHLGTMERERPGGALRVKPPQGGLRLEFLVENMGRVNYGPELNDRKGFPGGVLLGQQYLFGWTNYPLPLDRLEGLRFALGLPASFPAFLRGSVEVDQPADTYLALPGWIKGFAWINGFNLGRFWKRGPQKTLFIPGPLLRQGTNELIILELEGLRKPVVELRASPDLG